MLTIKQITENTEAVIRGLEKKHFKNAKKTIEQVIALNDKRRSTQNQLDKNLAEVNSLSRTIGQLMKEGKKEEAETARARVAELKEGNKELDATMTQAATDMQNALYTIPNIPYDSVPEGVGAEDNVVEKMGGMETELPKDALPHWELAKKYEVPLLRSKESTSNFIAGLIAFLNMNLAPRITRHGVLIEIYGEGVFITGESGVGKSETAIELVKRGHRLVADDAVEIRKVSNDSLMGSSPDNIRHFLELRGIGIINARRLFGIGAVKNTEKIELVVEMELWNPEKIYDRMGVDTQYVSILGVKVPSLTIPVKPGRNLAVILEVAAMNNRQKKMGYNAATELLDHLGLDMESKEIVKDYDAF